MSSLETEQSFHYWRFIKATTDERYWQSVARMRMREILAAAVRDARSDLEQHVQPRDETEFAICNALGECSWDECVNAILRYRAEQPSRT